MQWINGNNEHWIQHSDRGLQYGDGLFETIEILHGKPRFLALHLQRLQIGCERLLLPLPDLVDLSEQIRRRASGCAHGILKLILTRGSGGRGYRLPRPSNTTGILILHPYPVYPENYAEVGVNIRFCDLRLGCNPRLAGVKHLNRLEQVLARAEWNDADIQEGLLLDFQDNVIEGTMSNIFIVKSGRLMTPLLNMAGVDGVVRQVIRKLCEQLSMSCLEGNLSKQALLSADELFITNSVIGIWPVKKLQHQDYKIGSVTRQLQAQYQQLL